MRISFFMRFIYINKEHNIYRLVENTKEINKYSKGDRLEMKCINKLGEMVCVVFFSKIEKTKGKGVCSYGI